MCFEGLVVVGHNSEAEMFSGVKGEFGVPMLLGSYWVNEGHTMMVPDAKAWDIFHLNQAPEELELRWSILDHLRSSSEPKELVHVITHAMLGKCFPPFYSPTC